MKHCGALPKGSVVTAITRRAAPHTMSDPRHPSLQHQHLIDAARQGLLPPDAPTRCGSIWRPTLGCRAVSAAPPLPSAT